MQTVILIALATVWFFGTAWRVYRQAHFYQLEEYKSGRYLRWLFAERVRLLPTRPLGAVGLGLVFMLTTDSIPQGFSLMPYIVAFVSAGVAVAPAPQGRVKKPFVRTPRATRLLVASWLSVGVFLLIALMSLLTPERLESDRTSALVTQGIGALAFLGAPFFLILGNQLAYPIEAFLRYRFVQKARGVLSVIKPKVVGITGSYGKTTTKNYLRDILNGRYKTYATPKSYNTMMGVCIAINNDLADDYSVEYFICEMGAYVRGEIQRICDLTPPDIGIVIEVGPQHLERFGSLENIAIAKYELIKNVHPQGLGVFNWDNPYTRAMYERGYPKYRIAVSTQVDPANVQNASPRLVASHITETLDGLSFAVTDTLTGENVLMQTAVVGEHNVMNILLASAVALHEGMTLAQVAQRVRLLQPAESRLVRQTNEKGVVVINDAYSANPVGALSSLKVLGMYQGGRRLLITPGMIELGDQHEKENHRLGVLATQYATDIILVGEKQTAPIQDGVRSTAFPPERLQVVEHVADAIAWYQANLRQGDVVLLLNDLPDTYSR
jgi:UDP-N-acetylmuramoyl-tripeptide--D-alanyl-D-alanine ligase